MKKLSYFLFVSLALVAMVKFSSCSEEEVVFDLATLTAGEINLNGATAATGVPTTGVIKASFSKDIDPAGIVVMLTQSYDEAKINVTVTVSGKDLTLKPDAMAGGTQYILKVSGLKSTDGEAFANVERSFTTVGSFVPVGVFAYWPFDGNANDAVGAFDPSTNQIVGITYGADRKGGANGAAMFNGDNSIIEVSNGSTLMNTQNFTISFWVKTDATHDAGHFVFGLGAFNGIQFEIFGGYDGCKFAIQYAMADNKTGAEDMWLPALATDNTTGGWKGWDYAKSLTAEQMMAKLKNNWLNVVYTYNAADKKGTMYFDGVKMKSFDFDLWDEADAKRGVTGLKYGGKEPDVKDELAFGFVHSRGGTMWDAEPWGGYDFATANHFKGSLDEFRIFHKALTAKEIELMYNSEKGN